MSTVHRLADVYGVSRGVPKTYVSRVAVDGKFVNSLARDKHLVVFGGSKQGKTCLRKVCLTDRDYIVVQCGRGVTAEQIYTSVLKEAGASLSVTTTESRTGSRKYAVDLSGKLTVKVIAELEATGGYENEKGAGSQTEREAFEIDPSDPNDVIRVLHELKFTRYIILEDFHYLDEEVQRRLAVDLKAFHEKSSLCFIIVAVWRESNRLVLYNGDLAGRLIPVDADEWSDKELAEVIHDGEPLMNVKFDEAVVGKIVSGCQGNVGMLQECCYRILERDNVFLTPSQCHTFTDADLVEKIYRDIAQEQAGRYEIFLTDFVGGFQKTELEMYRWIAHVVVSATPEELKRGIKAVEVHRRIEAVHPQRDRLLYNNTLQALTNVAKLQYQKKVQPVILDFNPNETALHVVDGGFLVFLAARDRDGLVKLVTGDSQQRGSDSDGGQER